MHEYLSVAILSAALPASQRHKIERKRKGVSVRDVKITISLQRTGIIVIREAQHKIHLENALFEWNYTRHNQHTPIEWRQRTFSNLQLFKLNFLNHEIVLDARWIPESTLKSCDSIQSRIPCEWAWAYRTVEPKHTPNTGATTNCMDLDIFTCEKWKWLALRMAFRQLRARTVVEFHTVSQFRHSI